MGGGAVVSHRGTGQPLRGVAFEHGQRDVRMEGVLGRGDGTASAKVPRQLSVCANGWCVAAEWAGGRGVVCGGQAGGGGRGEQGLWDLAKASLIPSEGGNHWRVLSRGTASDLGFKRIAAAQVWGGGCRALGGKHGDQVTTFSTFQVRRLRDAERERFPRLFLCLQHPSPFPCWPRSPISKSLNLCDSLDPCLRMSWTVSALVPFPRREPSSGQT